MRRGENCRTVLKSQIQGMKLKGKPACPYCNKPLTFGYEDLRGHANQKCPNCGRNSFVDFNQMVAYKIMEDVVGV